MGKVLFPTQLASMWWVYILQSSSSGRYYIGYTDNLERRVTEHNSGQTASTRGEGPWVLVYSQPFNTKTAAYARERQIKSWKSRRTIEELIRGLR